MLGEPRLRDSTLMCDSGVWNSSVMMPCTTEMSLGAESSTTIDWYDRYSLASAAAVVKCTRP
jgi:hypothetical protein